MGKKLLLDKLLILGFLVSLSPALLHAEESEAPKWEVVAESLTEQLAVASNSIGVEPFQADDKTEKHRVEGIFILQGSALPLPFLAQIVGEDCVQQAGQLTNILPPFGERSTLAWYGTGGGVIDLQGQTLCRFYEVWVSKKDQQEPTEETEPTKSGWEVVAESPDQKILIDPESVVVDLFSQHDGKTLHFVKGRFLRLSEIPLPFTGEIIAEECGKVLGTLTQTFFEHSTKTKPRQYQFTWYETGQEPIDRQGHVLCAAYDAWLAQRKD